MGRQLLVVMLKIVAISCLLAVALAAPSGKELTVKVPKCSITFEEIESESCIPKAEKVCDTKDVEQAVVKLEKECKDVTAKVCAPAIKHKREAEAFGPVLGGPLGYATIKTDCREVTKQVCVPKPNKVTKTVPVTSCHIKQSVDCKPVKSKIPKQSCEEVETKVVAPVFGYHG